MKRNSKSGATLLRSVIVFAAVAFAAESVRSHENHAGSSKLKAPPPTQAVTLRGELIDPLCYFTHASRGPEHANCARMCAKGGQNLAFLHDGTGIVYPLVAKGHGENPNHGLLDHIGNPVQVKGTIYRIGPNSALLVESVSAVEDLPRKP